jgi:hypothetical protein
MSLASATMLKAPIRFFVHDGKWEIHAMSQSQQQRASLRIVRDVDQEEISCTAVRTFFKPAIAAKNIPFAIEWFAMDATYNEVRLTSAMTALENLLNSNLSKADQHYSRAFKKITREARQFVIECMGRLASGDSVPDPDVLSAKVNDLNRKQLIEKIHRLADVGLCRLRIWTKKRFRTQLAQETQLFIAVNITATTKSQTIALLIYGTMQC